MDAAGEKVTVSAVRSRAGVSMEAARLAVEEWRAQSRQAEAPIAETVQRAFAIAWGAAGQLVEAARAEAREAGDLVDAEAQRADKAEKRVARLTERLAELTAQAEGERREAATALAAERDAAVSAREDLAEMRGKLTVLQEQAALYWDKGKDGA